MFFMISYLVAALLTVAYSVAPGDEDSFCRGFDEGVDPPEVPPNIKILLDSFNYLNLLPPHATAVWQMVDNDDNNIEGGATTWIQDSNRPCRQSLNVCGFEQGTQDNWVFTQYINRTVNGTRLPQVSVLVELQLRGCPAEQNCQRTFVLNKYETSTVDNTTARNTSNYQLFSRVAPTDDSGINLQNDTSELDFDTDEEGFYLAVRDETTCISISRVIVSYNVCPQETEALVIRPETIAPQIDHQSPPLEVAAECVEGAIPENGVGATLICSQGGVWNTVPNTGCRCNTSFLASEDQRNCTSCPVGMYLSVVNEECRDCPENSEGVQSGLTVCPCVEEHYRAPGEEDLPCTRPPSEVRDLMLVSNTSTTITLIWDPPQDLGGRTDISYILYYQEEGSAGRVTAGIVNITMGTISGLSPGRQYVVIVGAVNGVSGLAGSVNDSATFLLELGCPVGMYLSVVNQECRDCPENSEGVQSGLTVCPCVEGYYRAPGEEDLPCTGFSQFPEAVVITVSVLATVALITVISIVLVFIICYKKSNRKKVTAQSPTEKAAVYHQDNMELQENVAYEKAHFSVSDRNCTDESTTYATVS